MYIMLVFIYIFRRFKPSKYVDVYFLGGFLSYYYKLGMVGVGVCSRLFLWEPISVDNVGLWGPLILVGTFSWSP